MANFKYSLNLTGTPGNKSRFIQELTNLGYKSYYTCDLFSQYLSVNQRHGADLCSMPNGKFNSYPDVMDRDYEFNIDNPWEFSAALAIASIYDDDIPHVGEWISGENSLIFFLKTGLHRVSEVNPKSFSFNVDGYASNPDWTSSFPHCRKATPEEIINFFKKSLNTETMEQTVNEARLMIPGEIIGYKSKRRLPWISGSHEFVSILPEGVIITEKEDRLSWDYFGESLKNPEWFEPVYRETEKILHLGSNQTEVIVQKDGIFVRGEKIQIETIERIMRILAGEDQWGNIAGWGIYFSVPRATRYVRIGCEQENNLFAYRDFKAVYDAYWSLD